MKDSEIIDALNCCYGFHCEKCPLKGDDHCGLTLKYESIKLIERLKAEIEEKKELLKACEIGIKDVKNLVIQNRKITLQIYNAYEQKIKISRAEAVKEFEDKLKAILNPFVNYDECRFYTVKAEDIKNLVKEVVGAGDET